MKLKDNIELKKLEKYGFIVDPSNCEVGDTYYHCNNYYYEFENSYGGEFRLVVNVHSREFEVLAMTKESGLIQLCNLDIFIELIKDGLVE